MALANKVIYQNGAIKKFEKPEVCEAIKVANANRWTVALSPTEWDQREKRLQKEYEKNTKAPGPGEEQSEDKSSSVPHAGLVYDQNFDVERLRQENKDLLKVVEKMKEGNPALNESASQFNDALLDELRKKIAAYKKLHFYDTKTLKRKDEIIKELRDKNAELLGMVERMKEDVKEVDSNLNAANKTNKCLNKKVVELTKIKGDLNSWISGLYFCIHHNNDNYKYKLKRLGKEISKLNSIIHDKNAVLADVSEDLRLTKIREKNLAELGLKYVGENEKLKKELADKVVDKIDSQALKSAESALAYKEKVITDLTKKLKSININRHNERIYKKQLAEKDEVIADLGKELKATKTELEEKTKLVEVVRKGSKEYCEYGIAAEKMIQKMAKAIVGKGIICSEDFEKYRLWANGYRFNPQLPDFSKEEEKKPSLFRDDSVGAVTNQKDCSPVKDTHPTEDNPEEVELDEILERVRKALEEGHTVSIDYDKAEEGGDQSATIVECGKDIDDVFEEIKRLCQE